MRRFLCVISVLLLCLGLCGCQVITKAGADTADDAVLYEHGMELVELLDEMLKTPEYFQMMGGSETISRVITPYMQTDFSSPGGAYIITLPEDALSTLMSAAEVDISGFSDSLREFVDRRAFSSLPSILNSRQGAEILAAASILTVSDSWVGKTLSESCYLLLVYPDTCPVMVSFTGKEGAISGTASLLPGDPINGDTLDVVTDLFEYLDLDGMDIRELDIDTD